MEPKFNTVLRALQFGLDVKLPDGQTYIMQDDELGVVEKNITTGEELFAKVDHSLNHLIDQANKMKDSEVYGLVFAMGMRKYQKDLRGE
jgi:hypothetical protein